MKDYRREIRMDFVTYLVQELIGHGYEVQTFPGTLLDNYLIELGENNLKMGKIKFRKYIIIAEKYVNEWSSVQELILTDNETLFNEYKERMCEYEDNEIQSGVK